MNIIGFIKSKYASARVRKIKDIEKGLRYLYPGMAVIPSNTASGTVQAITAGSTSVGGVLGDIMGNIAAPTIAKFVYVINLIIGHLAGLVFRMGGWLIEFTLKINNRILDPNMNTFVYSVWEVLLSVANLALILGIIYVAFATILRYENYRQNRLLFRLIAAALIINFSLVLAGIFIDIAGVLTEYFTNSFGDTAGIASAIAGAFNPQKLLEITKNDPDSFMGGFTKLGNATFISIASVVFSTLFTIASAIVLLAIAFMLLRRYIELSWRVALLPMVVMCWAFPFAQGKTYFNTWRKEFFRWTFFAPIMLFLVYLTLRALQMNNVMLSTATGNLVANENGSQTANIESSMLLAQTPDPDGSVTPRPVSAQTIASAANTQSGQAVQDSLWFSVANIASMVMAMMFLIYSLKFASSWSISGAKMANGWIDNVNNGAKNWAKNKALRGARRVGTAIPRTKPVQDLIEKGKTVGTTGGWFKRKFVLAPLVRNVSKLGEVAGVKQGQAIVKQAGDRIKNVSEKDLARGLRNLTPDKQIAAVEKIVKAKKVHEIPPETLDWMLSNEKMRDRFNRYGSKGAFENLEKMAGRNVEMTMAYANPVGAIDREIQKVKTDTTITEENRTKKIRELEEKKTRFETDPEAVRQEVVKGEADKFSGKFKTEDFRNIPVGTHLEMSQSDAQKKGMSEDARARNNFFSDIRVRQVVEHNPGAAGSILNQASTADTKKLMERFVQAQKDQLDDYLIKTGQFKDKKDITDQKLTSIKRKLEKLERIAEETPEDAANYEEIMELRGRAKGTLNAFKKSISKRLYEATEEEKEGEEGGKKKEGESKGPEIVAGSAYTPRGK